MGNRREGDYWFLPCHATSPSYHKSAGLRETVRQVPSDFYTWFTVKSAQGLLGCLFSQKTEPAETLLLCRGEGFTHLEVTGDAGIELYNFQYSFLIPLSGTKLCTFLCTCPEMLREDLEGLFCCRPKLHLKYKNTEYLDLRFLSWAWVCGFMRSSSGRGPTGQSWVVVIETVRWSANPQIFTFRHCRKSLPVQPLV